MFFFLRLLTLVHPDVDNLPKARGMRGCLKVEPKVIVGHEFCRVVLNGWPIKCSTLRDANLKERHHDGASHVSNAVLGAP